MKITTTLGICLFVILFGISFHVEAQPFQPSPVDCSAAELKRAEIKYQQTIKPLLATYADQYSGKVEELRRKEKQRSVMFREWLRMRCTCKPKSLTRFEKTLCSAVSENTPISATGACLVQN